MSDPVTNVEIEDVLSSIRRLVSDGDRARPSPPAADAVASSEQDQNDTGWFDDPDYAYSNNEGPTHDSAQEQVQSKQERFVLTPALMVVPNEQQDSAISDEGEDAEDASWFTEDSDPEPQEEARDAAAADESHDDHSVSEDHDDHSVHQEGTSESADHDSSDGSDERDAEAADLEPRGDADDAVAEADMEQSDRTDEAPLELTNAVFAPPTEDVSLAEAETTTAPNRSELVATIVELEAAVSTTSHDFEPDGSEQVRQTIAWPGATSHRPSAIDAAGESPPELSTFEPVEDSRVYDDDDLDDLIETKTAAMDEEAVRELISQVVREELAGPLGEKITRNVRKLVRREIYRILSSQEFD